MIPSIAEKYRLLVERLYSRTISGSIKWEYDEVFSEVSANVSEKSITLDEVRNDNDEPSIRLTIENKVASRKESFLDDDLKGRSPAVGDYGSWWKLMKDLYDYTVRKATGADDDIDDLLSHLDDDIPFLDDDIPF